MKKETLTILFVDGAMAFGGTINLLKMLFGEFDRTLIVPKLISALPRDELLDHFDSADISTTLSYRLSYTHREQLNSAIKNQPNYLKKLSLYTFTLLSWLVNIPVFLNLLTTLIREKPDLIHCNNTHSPLIAARLLNVPVIWHFHGEPKPLGFIYKYLHSKIIGYIAISNFIKTSAIKAGYPGEKIHTLLNPAPPPFKPVMSAESFRSRHSLPPKDMLITHIGRLVPWKGQMEFLKAFELIARQRPCVHAIIIGDDLEQFGDNYKQLLHEFVVNAHIDQKVTFLGHQKNPLEALYHSDIAVHSSLSPEPFGLVITEAMSTGTPIICAQDGATSEIIGNKLCGILCDPKDTKMLASNLLLLIDNSPLRVKMAQQGIIRSQGEFSLKSYSHKLASHYNQLL